MSKKLNCPNCGAVIDPQEHKCLYCGTSYFDLTCVDLYTEDPFYLKLKVKINDRFYYITQLVKSSNASIEMSNDYATISTKGDFTLGGICTNTSITTHLAFDSIYQPKDNLQYIVEPVE